MSWADVIGKFFDFLNKPNAPGVLLILAILGFLIYAAPLCVVTWTSWDNTNRLETAIAKLGDHCLNRIATTRKVHQPE